MIIETPEIGPSIAVVRYRFGPSLRVSVRLPGGINVTEGQEMAARTHVYNVNSNKLAFGWHKWVWLQFVEIK